MRYNPLILEAAEGYLGLEEWPGARHNPAIVKMFADSDNSWVQDDETPWCAAFIGSILAEVGLQGTGKLNARSYLDWGQPVQLHDVRPGDIAVFSRGDPNGWQGHVAIVVRFEGSRVIVRGGNQGNKVTDAAYPMSRLLGFRRADGGASASGRPVLRRGSQGRFVLDWQEALGSLGYHSGKKDGIFGAYTEGSTMEFQKANGLVSDGIVGRMPWAAMENAPRGAPARAHVSTKSLREAGSRTIAAADKTQVAQVVAAGAGMTGLAMEVQTARDGLEAVQATGTLGDILPWALAALSLVGVAVAAYSWWQANRAKAARVDDAQTGANLGR